MDKVQGPNPNLDEIYTFTEQLNARGEVTNEQRNAWNLTHAYKVADDLVVDGCRFGEALILDLHSILSRDIMDQRGSRIPGGRYAIGIRTIENTPWQPKPTTPPENIPTEMKTFGDQLDAYMHFYPEEASHSINVLQHAAELQIKLLDIHPFSDGNGRISRLTADSNLKSGGLYTMPHWMDIGQGELLERQANYFLMIEQARQLGDFRMLLRFMAQQQIAALYIEKRAINSNSQAQTEAEFSGHSADRELVKIALDNYQSALTRDLEEHPPDLLPMRRTKGHPPVQLTEEEIRKMLGKYAFVKDYIDIPQEFK